MIYIYKRKRNGTLIVINGKIVGVEMIESKQKQKKNIEETFNEKIGMYTMF